LLLTQAFDYTKMIAVMTPRENLLRSLRRQGFETVPVAAGGFCPSQVEAFEKRFGHRNVADWFGDPYRGIWVSLQQTYSDGRALYKRESLPEDTHIDPWGVGHSRRPGCWHMTRMHHPLKGEDVSLDEIRNYPMPVQAPDTAAKIGAMTAEIHGQNLASFGHQPCSVWETAWYIRSMEDLMTDMLDEDERARVLLDAVTDISCQRSATFAAAGCDIIELGDDIGMQHSIMMSVELWRTWLKPRLKRVIDAARERKPDVLIFYHSCGYIIPFLEELIEIGVDILNPVQPECMDFEEVYRLTGGRLSYWGTVGTQKLLPFGTPQEIRADIHRKLRICGEKGGILISPTHLVEPEVPWENLVAMRDAAREFVL